MNVKAKRMFVAGVLLTSCVFTQVAQAANCTTNSCTSYVDHLFYTGAGHLRFSLTTGHTYLLGCNLNSGKWLTLEKSHPGFALTASALRFSKVINSIVEVRVNDGSGECTVMYVVDES